MEQIKKGASLAGASLLAAYMAVQYTQSTLPLPDLIIPVPASWWRRWQAGGKTAELIAQELGKILSRPVYPLLKRQRQLFRQDHLSKEERKDLSPDQFQWKKKQILRGKKVLLVDDTITTGATLSCSAERLWEASPVQVIKMVCLDRGFLQQ